MAVADPSSRPVPPSPDECTHPAPVEGVMALEFGHYQGAIGPEGTRRTVTHYGPVVGGLPIAAWHCEECGLLRMRYPDGRREERRMFPGPQPGLLARASAVDPSAEFGGRQARVSGMSISRDLMPVLHAELPLEAGRRVWRWTLPDIGVVDIISVIGLVVVLLGLLVSAVLATYTYQTSPYENEAIWTTVIAFFSVVVLQIGAAAARHFLGVPDLPESAAVTLRGRPELDTATRTLVGFLVFVIVALVAAAVLATYDYNTPALEGPVILMALAGFVIALLIGIGRAAYNHFGHE